LTGDESADDLLARADKALYEAKETRGKPRERILEPSNATARALRAPSPTVRTT
jgi:GGDEF domain-containing protein